MTTKTKSCFDDKLKGGTYTVNLLIKPHPKHFKYQEYFLDDQRVIMWNNHVHNLLQEHLDIYIASKEDQGMDIKDAIEVFLHEVGLIDLISFDALKKANYRLRKSRQQLSHVERK